MFFVYGFETYVYKSAMSNVGISKELNAAIRRKAETNLIGPILDIHNSCHIHQFN
jgi:hypothetical protein